MRWTLVQFQKSAGRAIVRGCSNSSFSDLRPVTLVFPLRALSRRLSAGPYEMKANEQFRNIPANVCVILFSVKLRRGQPNLFIASEVLRDVEFNPETWD